MRISINTKLQLMQAEIQYVLSCLKVFSEFINCFPFWIPENGFESFQNFQTDFQTLCNTHKSILANIKNSHQNEEEIERILTEQLQQCTQTRNTVTQYLNQLFKNCLTSLNNSVVITKVTELSSSFNDLQTSLTKLYDIHTPLGRINQAHHAAYPDYIKTFENAFLELKKHIEEIKHNLVDNDIPHCLDENSLKTAKSSQHIIYAYQQGLKSFDSLVDNYQLNLMPTNSNFPKEAYADLTLLANLLKPEKVCEALKCKQYLIDTYYQEYQRKISFLNRRLNSFFSEAIRIQRTITAFQYWNTILSSIKIDHTILHSLITAIKIQSLLTYEKKAFFRRYFAEQQAHNIVQSLYGFITSSANVNKTNSILQTDLIAKKNYSRTEIQKKETKLKEHQSYIQSILSTLTLAVTQHPEYQLGRVSTQFTDILLTSSRLPILNEELSATLQNRLGYIVGLSYLTTSLLFSSRIGYSYHTIATINRIPLSQINMLFQAGQACDWISQYTGLPMLNAVGKLTPNQLNGLLEWVKNFIRFDELGVIEKETLIQWITGLGIILIITGGQSIIPTIMAYTVATGCREAAGKLTEKIAQKCGLNQQATIFAQVCAHITAYSFAYPYGFKLGQWLTRPKPSGLSDAEALNIFGLHANANEKEIKTKYKELALKFHPDKCKEECGHGEKMAEIYNAYEILTKKMQ